MIIFHIVDICVCLFNQVDWSCWWFMTVNWFIAIPSLPPLPHTEPAATNERRWRVWMAALVMRRDPASWPLDSCAYRPRGGAWCGVEGGAWREGGAKFSINRESLESSCSLSSTGLYYKRESLNLPEDTTEVYTCLEDAYHFLINSISMINSTSNRYYDRLYYLNQKTDRDKLRRSFNNYTCPMTMNLGNVNGHVVYIYDYLTLDKTNWKCLIPGRFVCDGFSNCLTDECGCGRKTTARSETQTPVFYCAQQPGCVTFPQVRKY